MLYFIYIQRNDLGGTKLRHPEIFLKLWLAFQLFPPARAPSTQPNPVICGFFINAQGETPPHKFVVKTVWKAVVGRNLTCWPCHKLHHNRYYLRCTIISVCPESLLPYFDSRSPVFEDLLLRYPNYGFLGAARTMTPICRTQCELMTQTQIVKMCNPRATVFNLGVGIWPRYRNQSFPHDSLTWSKQKIPFPFW